MRRGLLQFGAAIRAAETKLMFKRFANRLFQHHPRGRLRTVPRFYPYLPLHGEGSLPRYK